MKFTWEVIRADICVLICVMMTLVVPAVRGATTGGQDRLSDPFDVELLLETLPLDQLLMRHHEPSYEHLDFIWGINAATRVYSRVMDVLGELYDMK